MTAQELCFTIAAIVFVAEALPAVRAPFNLLAVGLALVAFGLALGAGLDEHLAYAARSYASAESVEDACTCRGVRPAVWI